MSNILCASFCCLNSQCDLYHFNTVNSVCATFEKPSSFRLAADLLSDPDWSTGYIHDICELESWVLGLHNNGLNNRTQYGVIGMCLYVKIEVAISSVSGDI